MIKDTLDSGNRDSDTGKSDKKDSILRPLEPFADNFPRIADFMRKVRDTVSGNFGTTGSSPEGGKEINYKALAREASEFSQDSNNYARTSWLRDNLRLTISLSGLRNILTLIVPLGEEGDIIRERLHRFVEEYMKIMKKNRLQIPDDGSLFYTPLDSTGDHINHEKFNPYFSTTFWEITAGTSEFRKLTEEYNKALMYDHDICRARALWLLENFGVNIFYKKGEGETPILATLESGAPDIDSSPDWSKLGGGFIVSGRRFGDRVWSARFSRDGSGYFQSDAFIPRVPMLLQ